MQLDEDQIVHTLDRLGVQREDHTVRGWLGILCPFHYDRKFGNASVNLSTSVFNCFSCGHSTNLIGITKKVLNAPYLEAKEFIQDGLTINPGDQANRSKLLQRKTENEPSIDLTLEDFDPEDYFYTKLRGFTKDFLNVFNIKKCTASLHDYGEFTVKNLYKGYFIIPIYDHEKNIRTLEARKLVEYETLSKLFKVENMSLARLKSSLSKYVRVNEIKYRKGKLFQRGETIENRLLSYLLKPKVLYPPSNQIGKTIFNISSLDLNADLYIIEGIAGIPKVWSTISKNVTATFGAKLTNEQIRYLKQFKKRKILLPDFDEASDNLIRTLNDELRDFWILPIEEDDTHLEYSTFLTQTQPIEASRYLVRKHLSGIA